MVTLRINFTAVQNERDRISGKRFSTELISHKGLSVASLLQAEMMSRQVGAALEVSEF